MKVDVATPFVGVCLFLATSMTLHGCDVAWDSTDREEIGEPPEDKESTARCAGGKMDCSADSRKWCAEQVAKCKATEEKAKAAKPEEEEEEEEPKGKITKPTKAKKTEVKAPHPDPAGPGCLPECNWDCEVQKCHQQCTPKCNAPVCTTRCMNFKASGCKMQCGKPSCTVVCPKKYCPHRDCPQCKTVCGKAVCAMKCPETDQNCRHVCAKPACKWNCKAPKKASCPKPKCALTCQKPRTCKENTEAVNEMPPLEPGETEVSDAAFSGNLAPAMVQVSNTMRVNITTMGHDGTAKTHEVDLSLAQADATEVGCAGAASTKTVKCSTKAVETEWSTKIKNGQVSEATCTNGRFHCHGDAAWCAGEEKMLCKSGRRQARMQGHLRA